MKATKEQLKRFQRDLQEVAQEPVSVEQIHDTYYVFGSELACLRIYYKYRKNDPDTIEVIYSKNLNSWIFSLTPMH
jgi:hypothetical protein